MHFLFIFITDRQTYFEICVSVSFPFIYKKVSYQCIIVTYYFSKEMLTHY